MVSTVPPVLLTISVGLGPMAHTDQRHGASDHHFPCWLGKGAGSRI